MAEMWAVIIKNNEVSDYLVEDLGISVLASGSINFHEQFHYDEIAGSDDLRVAVNNSDLIVNNGIEDLTAISGVEYLTLENLYHLEENYYSKIELQTSGQSQVHWDNITNAPSFTEGNTLDDAYDEGGAGAGRTIVVDSGPVKFDATVSGSYAPVELTELSVLPTTGLAAGQLGVKEGILYVYDGTRSKWLSAQRMFLNFGRRGFTRNQFLAFGAGLLYSNNSGYRLSRSATIVSMTGQLDASGSCNIRVRKNDNTTNIATLNIAAAIGNEDNTLNIDLNGSDYLQAYLENTSYVQDPIVIVEIAWRG